MSTLSFEKVSFLAGATLTIVLLVLDKANKLASKPVLVGLLVLAAVLTLPLALGNEWAQGLPKKVWKPGLLVVVVILVYSALALWVLGDGPSTNVAPSSSTSSAGVSGSPPSDRKALVQPDGYKEVKKTPVRPIQIQRTAKAAPASKSATPLEAGSIIQQSSGANSPNVIGNNNQFVFGKEQRHLTGRERAAFIEVLSRKKNTAYVSCYATDQEGCIYARDFFEAFKQAGWDVGNTVASIVAPLPTDSEVRIAISSGESRPDGFDEIYDALKAASITPKGLVVPNLKANELALFVGSSTPN